MPFRHRDSQQLREALRAFATGVTVVTSAGAAGLCGVTVNAFTSVSLTPPLVLVCLAARTSITAIANNRVFAVNVLSAEQEWLASRFASPLRPRGSAAFHDVPHRVASTGAPILDGAATWLDCRLYDLHAAGDHRIAIGEVVELSSAPGRAPLVFHDGRLMRLPHTITQKGGEVR